MIQYSFFLKDHCISEMAGQVRFADVSYVSNRGLDIGPVLSQIYLCESSQQFYDICAISLVLQMRKLGLREGK